MMRRFTGSDGNPCKWSKIVPQKDGHDSLQVLGSGRDSLVRYNVADRVSGPTLPFSQD